VPPPIPTNKICGAETETGVCFRLRTHPFPPHTLPLSASIRRKGERKEERRGGGGEENGERKELRKESDKGRKRVGVR